MGCAPAALVPAEEETDPCADWVVPQVQGQQLVFEVAGYGEASGPSGVELEAANALLALQQYHPDFGDELWVGETLAATPVTCGTAVVGVGTPPGIEELFPEQFPGLEGAFFLPTILEDEDGDGQVGEGEIYLGVGLATPVYLRGEIPEFLSEVGVSEGWSVLQFDSEEGGSVAPEVFESSHIPLPANLWPVERLELSGAVGETGSAGEGALRAEDGMAFTPAMGLALVPIQLVGGPAAEADTGGDRDLLLDGPLQPDWSMVVEGRPPDDHMYVDDVLDIPVAVEVPVAYEDLDRDGAFDIETLESPLLATCHDGRRVTLNYHSALDDLMYAMFFAVLDYDIGWMLLETQADGSDAIKLSGTSLHALEISQDCELFGAD
ncbi:MAG: hypothetical protein QGG40_07785 [Myxococcota bacterium]|nr:hypothetical protein [Myxococcota bacterium]